jgi:hypothetical protein
MRWLVGFPVVAVLAVAGCGGRGETFERPDPGPFADGEALEDAATDVEDALDAAPDDAVAEEDVPADGVEPGGFGAPCVSNSDCLSKVCVESAEGFVCSQICQEECPTGWYCRATTIGSDIVSVCVPVGANLCKACKLDGQCGDGLCIDSPEGRVCGRDCSASACPEGYDCEDATGSEGDASRQCVPRSGACSCRPATAGVERPCVVESGTSKCLGIETCDPELGWVGCTARTPLPEGCNGIDDDCNGVADDDPAKPVDEQGKPVECRIEDAALGASCPCQWVCRGEQGWEKAGPAPKAEECNYLDDDCNGETDEGFKDVEGRYDGTADCGGCGNDCEAVLPFAKAVSCDVTGVTAKCLVDECIAGYVKSGPSLCVPQVSNLCTPCVDDANCGSSGEKCLALGSGKSCGRDCAEGSPFGTDCPGGYACKDYGDGVSQCVPESGTCDCTAANAGMQRVCSVVAGPWQCIGVETCDPAKGWVDCDAKTPVAETCDGADQNCNGFADETFPELKATCWAGLGACRREGTYMCNAAGDGVECNAVPGPEAPESCNWIDDDCDGSTDEDWPDRGKGCLSGLGECRRAGALVCNPEGTALRCDAVEGVPAAEVCDGLDNDCNGNTDEDPKWADVGTVCTVGQGACSATGVLQCNAADRAGPPVCSASPGTSGAESCNGIDDDCDGGVDEDWPDRGKGCLAGKGECQRAGALVCNAGGTALRCDAVEGSPSAEVCDGLDNDCDGSIDEDATWSNKGTVCTAGQGVCVRSGVWQCSTANPSGPTECSATPGAAGTEVCDGLDNDCDGSTDEGALWSDKGTGCTAGTGECQRSGARICDASSPSGPTVCSATPGTAGVEVCDGLDNDCDGSTDEGAPWSNKGTVCTTGLGVCQRSGVWQCNGSNPSGATVCSATAGTPETEVCDYLDNDCDGTTDNGFQTGGKYTQNTACGNCFTDCTAIYAKTNAYGTCNAVPATPTCVMNCYKPGTPAGNADDYYNLNAIPDDGCEFKLDTAAIYVSTNDAAAANDTTCGNGPVGTGTGNHPCKTITYGLSRAGTGKTKVLVADGQYLETVTMAGGKDLRGGYRADTWERHVTSTLTAIRGTGVVPSTSHRVTVIASGITSATTLEGFIIQGQVNTTTGGNSYAIYASGSNASLQILNNVVYGGSGGPGLDQTAAGNGTAGVSGLGRNNDPAHPAAQYDAFETTSHPCGSGNNRQYANGGTLTCGASDVVSGGNGGGNRCAPSPGNEYSGIDGVAGNAGDGVLGGAAGAFGDAGDDGEMYNSLCYLPSNPQSGVEGSNGSAGGKGNAGGGCTAPVGSVVSGHWVGGAGVAATAGGNGGGGGGGGAGGGGSCTGSGCSGHDRLGAHGGGGGSGGCGGSGGQGGLGGGGAFGVFLVGGTAPVIQGTIVYMGIGGDGGSGGNGGVGGLGGNGGDGGQCPGSCWCFHDGGKGGEGGSGGAGGGGGGGCGGSAYGVYTSGVSGAPNYCGAGGNAFSGGAGGYGGAGGISLGSSGAVGGAGVVASCSFN